MCESVVMLKPRHICSNVEVKNPLSCETLFPFGSFTSPMLCELLQRVWKCPLLLFICVDGDAQVHWLHLQRQSGGLSGFLHMFGK